MHNFNCKVKVICCIITNLHWTHLDNFVFVSYLTFGVSSPLRTTEYWDRFSVFKVHVTPSSQSQCQNPHKSEHCQCWDCWNFAYLTLCDKVKAINGRALTVCLQPIHLSYVSYVYSTSWKIRTHFSVIYINVRLSSNLRSSMKSCTTQGLWCRAMRGWGYIRWCMASMTESWLVGWLEFNVPFEYKYGYIRDERTGVESYPLTQWRKIVWQTDRVMATPEKF